MKQKHINIVFRFSPTQGKICEIAKEGNKNVIKLFFFGVEVFFPSLWLAFFCLHHHVSFFLFSSSSKSINNNVDIYSFFEEGVVDLAERGTLAGLKVYEICVKKNIIVSHFLCYCCHTFWCEDGILFADGEMTLLFFFEIITM